MVKLNLARWIAVLFWLLFACGFQTAFWPNVFGALSCPPLWFMILLWVIIYRDHASDILAIYFYGPFIVAFSAMPLKIYFWVMFCTYMLAKFFRRRVFWPSIGYFVVVATAGVFFFQIEYYIFSRWLERNPTSLLFGDRFFQVLLTPAFALIIHHIMRATDRFLIRVLGIETGIVHE